MHGHFPVVGIGKVVAPARCASDPPWLRNPVKGCDSKPHLPIPGGQNSVFTVSTQELLLEEIRNQPEPVLLEVLHYLKFLTRQREEEAWADVLPSRKVEQEVLDQIDSK